MRYKSSFSEMFMEICIGLAAILLSLCLCSMGMLCMLSYVGLI